MAGPLLLDLLAKPNLHSNVESLWAAASFTLCDPFAVQTGEQVEEHRHSTVLQHGEERMLLGQAWS